MKRTLLHNVEQLRYFAMLLIVAWCGSGIASALESDDINTAILVEGSTVIPKWTDDATNPWVINDNGTEINPPTFVETVIPSTMTMTFSSQYSVYFNIDKWIDLYSNSTFIMIIDGEESSLTDTSWSTFERTLPAGDHKIEFLANFTNSRSGAGLKNVYIKEYRPLETACLKEGSMPITFENDPDYPWLTEDGYIQSMNYGIENSSSTVSTTFKIDKPSLFSFEYQSGYDYYDNNVAFVNVDGVSHVSKTETSWSSESLVLYPGEHTIVFGNTHTWASSNKWTRVRNVRLDQNWLNVTLSQPGELSVRILQALGDKNLQDAELVKISGSLNDNDWATIDQLTGIVAVDFTDTDITSIPSGAFSSKSRLSTVVLPNTVKEIGDNAFAKTDFYEITIPSSVETIGNEAWKDSNLRYINFPKDSKLTTIGYSAFYNTRIMKFIMPNSVTTLLVNTSYGYNYSNLFTECSSLRTLHLSDGLTTVPRCLAYDAGINEVHLPINATSIRPSAFYNNNLTDIDIPESVTSIGDQAFYNNNFETLTIPKNVTSLGSYAFNKCTKLKELYLNSHCWNMDYTFDNCTALQKVVLPCATPPSISHEPFYYVTKSNIQLIVPDFALQSYRTDTYWYNFTNCVASDEASLNDYWAIRGNLSLDSSRSMQGTPSAEIMTGGTMTLDTDMAQAFDEFTFNTSESAPGAFLSKSNNITANSLTSNFYVSTANKWFFFSPVTDVNMADVTYPSTDSWVIRYYDGERRGVQNDNSGNWVNMPADGVLKRGQGYIIQAASTGWLNMPAAADKHEQFFGCNEVDFELADNASENEANAGWNFVSNPYPCYYDIYYIDMQAPITVWNGSTYRAYSLNDGDRGDDTFVLRPMQPFFVQKASADLTTGMPLTGRRTSTVIDRTSAPKREAPANNELRDKLNLELFAANNEEADDYTRIVLNEEASMDYEIVRDASKFMSMDSKVAQLFSLGNDNTPMAINERPYDNGIVALGIYLPVNGETYTISATRADRQAWIYDAETGIEHDLTTGDYVFTANKEGFDYKRFSIRFSPKSTTAVETVEGSQVKVTAANGAIIVTAAEDADVAVYATDGTTVANVTGSAEINVPAGVYLVKVNDRTFKTIVK